MSILECHYSQDGRLVLILTQNECGETILGFDGGDWHTHPESISFWLNVAKEQAIDTFKKKLFADELPIITSTNGGRTFEPWVSDNLLATLRMHDKGSCVVRYWSGATYFTET